MHTQYLQRGFNKQLSHFIEECGEVLAAAGKTQRWGLKSYNPLLAPTHIRYRETNKQWLIRELNDLTIAMERLKATMARQR